MLKYRPARTAAVALAAVLALWPLAVHAADATWESWVSIPGATDVDGPRSDGQLLVMGSAALYLVDSTGNVQSFARGPGGYHDDPGLEAYVAVSHGEHVGVAGCDFGKDDTYILRVHVPMGVTRVSADGGDTGPLANSTGAQVLGGIAFDTGGGFDHRLLVLGINSTNSTLTAVDCMGQTQLITAALPPLEGQMAIAPAGFGQFADNLIIPDETGRVLAVAPDGSIRTVVGRPLPAGVDVTLGGLGFVPPGFMAHGGYAYHANHGSTVSNSSASDGIYRVSAGALLAAGVQDGDLLAVAEDGGAMISVHCESSCRAVRVIAGNPAAHVEGHVAFAVNQPPPSASPVAQATQVARYSPGLVDFIGAWGVPLGLVVIVLVFGAGIGVAAMRRRGR